MIDFAQKDSIPQPNQPPEEEEMEQFLVTIPIRDPASAQICGLAQKLWEEAHVKPDYLNFLPHMTLHRPLSGINERDLKNAVASAVTRMKQTKITLHAFYPFGRQYIVLPAHATLGTALLLVEMNRAVTEIPGYQHSVYDFDNTLHVTIVENMTPQEHERAWQAISVMKFKPMIEVPARTIAVFRKPNEGSKWQNIDSFVIPS